jgi:carbon monoxide dehydrogenase subunit G
LELVQEFTVSRPVRTVWVFFQDIVEVAKCLPGAEVTEIREDGSYAGRLQVKLGPMTVTFEGDAVVAIDEAAHTGTIEGAGADRRGGSRGKIKVAYGLSETGEGTFVSVHSEIQIAGPAAQFGRPGLLREMSERLVEDFVAHLEAKLDAPDAEAAAVIESGPPAGGVLVISSLWAVFVRFLRRLLGRGRGAA